MYILPFFPFSDIQSLSLLVSHNFSGDLWVDRKRIWGHCRTFFHPSIVIIIARIVLKATYCILPTVLMVELDFPWAAAWPSSSSNSPHYYWLSRSPLINRTLGRDRAGQGFSSVAEVLEKVWFFKGWSYSESILVNHQKFLLNFGTLWDFYFKKEQL